MTAVADSLANKASQEEARSKYYNAVVQVAKYGYKVGDNIIVRVFDRYAGVMDKPIGVQLQDISTYKNPNITTTQQVESWQVYFDANPKATPEIKLLSEIKDKSKIIWNGNSSTIKETDNAQSKGRAIDTDKIALYVGIGLVVLIIGYFSIKNSK